MDDIGRLLLGSLAQRPYVFGFLALYLVAAAASWGWLRAVTFTGLAGSLAFLAEFSSTRIGVPFGLYHYTGVTRGQELYLANVPFFDPLSFAFLAWASLGLARVVRARLEGRRRAGVARSLVLAATAGLLMMWLDLVIDPLAVRGDRWFLGRVFYYPEPGWYFGVPTANFAGWAVLGAVIAALWLVVEPRLGGRPSVWGERLPGRVWYPVLVYYLVLLFNLSLTGLVAEPALFWAGVLGHLPLVFLVICCVSFPVPVVTAGESA